NFQSPCYLGDQITVEGEVLDKSDSTRIITIKTSIYNQDGSCLVDGTAKVIMRED
ncbi:MAG: enoyl-CoA hydratase, partial [Nitrosopumilaceae archaeon]|nr:enoyl-CoA hydratase [Nitrosopumilaceae archaeon]